MRIWFFYVVRLFARLVCQDYIKLQNGFLQNLDGGWASAQNRHDESLVRLQIKRWIQDLFLTFFIYSSYETHR